MVGDAAGHQKTGRTRLRYDEVYVQTEVVSVRQRTDAIDVA